MNSLEGNRLCLDDHRSIINSSRLSVGMQLHPTFHGQDPRCITDYDTSSHGTAVSVISSGPGLPCSEPLVRDGGRETGCSGCGCEKGPWRLNLFGRQACWSAFSRSHQTTLGLVSNACFDCKFHLFFKSLALLCSSRFWIYRSHLFRLIKYGKGSRGSARCNRTFLHLTLARLSGCAAAHLSAPPKGSRNDNSRFADSL